MAAPLKVTRLLKLAVGRPTLGFKRSFSKYRCLRQQSSTDLETTRKWQLHSAVLLQRPPVVSSELNPFEKEVDDYMTAVEIDRSLLSDHELAVRKYEQLKQETKVGGKVSKEEVLLTPSEMEDEWKKERDQFTLAERITDADRNKDMTTPNRKLDEKIFLIVKQKFSEESEPIWMFPQIGNQQGESMRQTAERALSTHYGQNVKACFLGNAPFAYKKYKLPQGYTEYGVKVFFFKADYRGGDIEPNPNSIVDHKWVTLNEMRAHFRDKEMMLFEDILEE